MILPGTKRSKAFEVNANIVTADALFKTISWKTCALIVNGKSMWLRAIRRRP